MKVLLFRWRALVASAVELNMVNALGAESAATRAQRHCTIECPINALKAIKIAIKL